MTDLLRRSMARLASLRGVAPAARRPALRSLATTGIGRLLKQARRRAITGQVRVVQIVAGHRAANRFFWATPTNHPTWFDVQNRLERLGAIDSTHADHFVAESLRRTTDPITMVNLARHPLSAEQMRAWFESGTYVASASRAQENRLLGGAVAGAAKLLLPAEQARPVLDWVNERYQVPDDRLFQFVDSVGWSPRSAEHDDAPAVHGPVRHRLIIAEHFNDPESIALLLPGAERTTLLATTDTFGMADFSPFEGWPGVGSIRMEHIRSRITRFSQAYIDIHTATTVVAQRATDLVADLPGLLDADARPFVTVDVADFLFFQALKIRAIEELLADPDIDHVVVALGEPGATMEFPHLLAGVEGLVDDPRLDVVSVSRSAAIRSDFWSVVDQILAPDLPSPRSSRRVPAALVVAKFDQYASALSEQLPSFPDHGAPAVLVATANNAAYNQSTAGYAYELTQQFDVTILHIGHNATELVSTLNELGAPDVPLFFLNPVPDRVHPTAELVRASLSRLDLAPSETPAERAAAWAFRCTLPRLTTSRLAPALARSRALSRYLERLSATGELPAAIAITPNRNPGVSCITAAARRVGVPTIALEPHMQDANYSRYIKVAADYYGVMSDYFRTHAARGFGTDPERTTSIGSPRQIAPANYDRATEQKIARAAYSSKHSIVFDEEATHLVYFCQPSDWRYVSRVWSMVLQAAAATKSVILLKTHPEESANRVVQYVDLATSMGMVDRVVILDCDAADAIAMADIALTAYSTAAIDAAIRSAPVVCVADGETPYPIDLPAIVRAPRVESHAELAELITRFREDPDELCGVARSLLEQEPQFQQGPGPRLRALVADAITQGTAGLRDPMDVPDSLFLDGPHPVFPV